MSCAVMVNCGTLNVTGVSEREQPSCLEDQCVCMCCPATMWNITYLCRLSVQYSKYDSA